MKRTRVILAGIATVALTAMAMAENINADGEQENPSKCSAFGAQVRPMTAPFAASLGMAVPYGAIFDQPQPDSPAARAGIAAGDVVTSINGSPLRSWLDFAPTISNWAPGGTVRLTTRRNGQLRQLSVTLGWSKCESSD
jgi:S1-C subfamily serine protease